MKSLTLFFEENVDRYSTTGMISESLFPEYIQQLKEYFEKINKRNVDESYTKVVSPLDNGKYSAAINKDGEKYLGVRGSFENENDAHAWADQTLDLIRSRINESVNAESSATAIYNLSIWLPFWQQLESIFPDCENIESDDYNKAIEYAYQKIIDWFPLDLEGDDDGVEIELKKLIADAISGKGIEELYQKKIDDLYTSVMHNRWYQDALPERFPNYKDVNSEDNIKAIDWILAISTKNKLVTDDVVKGLRNKLITALP